MEMLEDIIRIPIFSQIAVFGLQCAIDLYEIEMVSDSLRYISWYEIKTFFFQNITTFSINLITFLGATIFASIVNYILCYFVTTSTINVSSIGDRIYELHWYRLSRDDQVIIRMIIRRAQKPFELKALGIFVCSLQTYLKVNRQSSLK